MKKYIKIMRIDHWIKQLMIVPGTVFACFLIGQKDVFNTSFILRFTTGLIATCLIASANYVINEWLDREYDKYHPVKKYRAVVEEGANPTVVVLLYSILTIAGILLAMLVGLPFLLTEAALLVMGILYNVNPIRLKDRVYIDVLSESVNNAIRLLLGWFIVTEAYLPPSSIVIGYWFAGAFLMATKRFSEYRMIGQPELAGLYRKSFLKYNEKKLIISAFFYAMGSTFFVGVFLVKYKIELVLLVPLIIILFCYYFTIAFKEDSAAQRPEKLYKEKGLMILVLLIGVLFLVLMNINIPWLASLTSSELITIR